MADRISVAIIDDHPLFRDGLACLLKAQEEFELVANGESYEDALKIAKEKHPHILLVDIMLRSGGVKVLNSLAPYMDQTKVIVITSSEKLSHVSVTSSAGARGYVLKTETGGALIQAMRTIHRGETYITPRLAASMFKNMKRRKAALAIKSELKTLTKREAEILSHVGQGLTNKEIALKLGIREKTVKHYMTNIMNKLQVQNRVQAALLAQRSAPVTRPIDVATQL